MILGWFRRRRMERDELEELREFADDMEQLLENLDFLLSREEESEVPVELRDLWHARYFDAPRNYSHHNAPISDLDLKLRRTPAQRQELAHRVMRGLQDKMTEYIISNRGVARWS